MTELEKLLEEKAVSRQNRDALKRKKNKLQRQLEMVEQQLHDVRQDDDAIRKEIYDIRHAERKEDLEKEKEAKKETQDVFAGRTPVWQVTELNTTEVKYANEIEEILYGDEFKKHERKTEAEAQIVARHLNKRGIATSIACVYYS